MLISLRACSSLTNEKGATGLSNNSRYLDVEFDREKSILWMNIAATSTPYFSAGLLDDIRSVQSNFRRSTLSSSNSFCDAVKYVVLASRIPKVFSLGGDLRLFKTLIETQNRNALADYARKATDAVYSHAMCPEHVSSISLVQGVAMGGGFEAALSGNVVIAEKGTRLGFPEVLFGLFPGMGAYTLLRRRVSAAVAETLICSAKNYSAEELLELGVVDLVCEPGEGRSAVHFYTSGQGIRSGKRAFKKAINRCSPIDRKELLDISESWVDTALDLGTDNLKRISRLVKNQEKNFLTTDSCSRLDIRQVG